MESAIMKLICSNQGMISSDDLLFDLCLGDPADVQAIISNQEKFASYIFEGGKKVVARTNMRLCRAKDCQGCRQLHLCKNYLFLGSCPYSRRGRGCIFSHQLDSDYNARILREHELEDLDRSQLCTLLLQSDTWLLPPICFDYNNADNRCKDGDNCKRLHICEKYLKGDCMCFRNHDFYTEQPLKVLRDRKVPDQLMHSLKSVYFNKMALRICDNRNNKGKKGNKGNPQQPACSNVFAADHNTFTNSAYLPNSIQTPKRDSEEGDESRDDGPNRRPWQRPNRNAEAVRDKTDICMYFIKGTCKHGDRCFKAHEKLPYRWEVRQGDRWIHMSDNETIEKDFCDPKNTYSSTSPPVHFDTMTCGGDQVRRLSTISSVQEPTFVLTTEWIWYWEDEFGKWNQYASSTGGRSAADMDSTQLEQKFLNNDKDVVEFVAGAQTYSLSFQDMIQSNKHYSTKRLVRRRPVFVSAADVHTRKFRKPQAQPSFTSLPTHWDKTQIPEKGYKRVSLQSSSGEYEEIKSLFFNTMRGFEIVKIERVQNKALWEIFQWQKEQMKKNNSGQNVSERKLFHGTDPAHVDAICHNNFDWRICGTHGTAYGNGSYFARDAKYSHSYTGDVDVKSMFVSRVLVGDFTRGSSDYRRPPSKDGGDTLFYDSCVDNILDPSIFVVFEKHQIYPEYLLQYKEKSSYAYPSASVARPAPRPVPVPVRAPQPVPAPRPAVRPSISIYQAPVYTPPPPVQPVYRTSLASPSRISPKKKSDTCVIC